MTKTYSIGLNDDAELQKVKPKDEALLDIFYVKESSSLNGQ